MSELESQMTLPPVREWSAGGPELRERLLLSGDRVLDRVCRDSATATAILDVCSALQSRWLDPLKQMPDFSADPASEKRKDDFYRAVALGIELAAQTLTEQERLESALPARGDTKER